MLAITTPVTDWQLLTIEEMRELAGITGNSQDAKLSALGLSVAASIAAECNIAVGVGGKPTLLRETCSETLRDVDRRQLLLSRRHDITITSVTQDGTALTADQYEVDAESGLVTRLVSDAVSRWCARKIVVVYDAGFDQNAIPGDLRMAASDFFRLAWQEAQRDPALKSEEVEIPGVDRVRRDFWVGSVPGQSSEGAVPDIVAGQLKRFRNMVI